MQVNSVEGTSQYQQELQDVNLYKFHQDFSMKMIEFRIARGGEKMSYFKSVVVIFLLIIFTQVYSGKLTID